MNDEIDSIEGFLDGDDFVNEQTKEEEAARQRRLKRKRRLEQIQNDTPGGTVPCEKVHQGARLEISKEAVEINKRNSGSSSFSLPSHVDNDTLRNQHPDIGINNKDTDAGEFDMFSSSVSPPSRVPGALRNQDNNNLHRKVNNQQDWDDAEGYYKATIGQWYILLRLRNLQYVC